MEKPELDYAFLAEYASVVEGKLTVVGASFTVIRADVPSPARPVYIAGRFRVPMEHETIHVGVTVVSPHEGFSIEGSFALEEEPGTRTYLGRVGRLFSAGLEIPLTAEGLYEVLLTLDGEQVRRLAFDVERIDQSIAMHDSPLPGGSDEGGEPEPPLEA